MAGFRKEMDALGYREGKNLVIEPRYANGDRGKLPGLAAELARSGVDVFFAPGEPALLAVKASGNGIPIVTVTCDPLEKLLGSLARPGGNATGFTCVSSDLAGKRLGLFKALLPNASRVAILYSPADNDEADVTEIENAGGALGLQIRRFSMSSPNDFTTIFRSMSEQHCDAVYILASSFANQYREKFAALAGEARLPSIYGFREYADAGGLMSYGASFTTGFRRAAHQVDKILQGASPTEIPVEQPTRFELVLNAKAAKAIGVDFPPSLLAQADEVIE